MRIGLDFDNTIVCYDHAIKILAEQLFELPQELPRTKLALRDFLRATGRELAWTEFQGELYGPGMRYAQPFKNAIGTMKNLVANGHELVIVSHRSRHPYAGQPHDLHRAAKEWIKKELVEEGLFGGGEGREFVYFLESATEKCKMIEKLACNAFVDDLPEILLSQRLPECMQKIHFSPLGSMNTTINPRITILRSWVDLPAMLNMMGG